ncbi:MAG: 7-carboxy-7-deazaguanine synthase QueE [Candidatus Obscuribacterales bacterium]|nr:7-carboxy-7-deazaguanine synthase QueE [Candidatus Obscuribacterales bacterium]
MRGTNPVRQQDTGDGTSLWVQEIFHTLQGEGPFSGQRAVFIRLAGCNLRCFWCDTDFESSEWQPTLTEIVEQVETIAGSTKLVVVTGGEPFRQNIAPLVNQLLSLNYKVQIETNGTLWVELPESDRLFIVVSPKTEKLNQELVRRATAYKYAISHRDGPSKDGLPISSTQIIGNFAFLARPTTEAPVYVMPIETDSEQETQESMQAAVASARSHGHTLTLQLHKVVGIR